MKAWRAVLREPIVHFLVAGLVLFAAAAMFSRGEDEDGRRIVVDEAALVHFLQRRSAIPDLAGARAAYAALTLEERSELAEAFKREEVLFREALAIGLERRDDAIRARLVQQMMQTIDTGAAPAPNEAALRAYFGAHAAKYRREPTVSFEQIFFSAGDEARAKAALGALKRGAKPEDVGDLAPWPRLQPLRSEAFLEREFGQSVAAALFDPSARTGEWFGPVRSAYGLHLLRLAGRSGAAALTFEEAQDQVEADWRTEQTAKAQLAQWRKLAAGYAFDVRIPLAAERQPPAAAP